MPKNDYVYMRLAVWLHASDVTHTLTHMVCLKCASKPLDS